MKTGLILEGGAMRGLFTAGVLDVLMEEGLRFDGIIGVSAGAAFGCNYKSGQIGRVLRYNTRFCADPRYGGWRSLWKTGDLYSKEFCYGEVPLIHDPFDFKAFEADPTPFYVVCTDVEKGTAVYHCYSGQKDHGFDWIRASASMPLVSQIVEIDGQKLLDGGIADSIPLRAFQDMGFTKNVVVLTRPAHYRKKKNALLPLMRLRYRAYPAFIRAAEERQRLYNETLEEIERKEQEGSLFVLRPQEDLPVGRTEKDPKKLTQAYEIGRHIALSRRKELLAFLQK